MKMMIMAVVNLLNAIMTNSLYIENASEYNEYYQHDDDGEVHIVEYTGHIHTQFQCDEFEHEELSTKSLMMNSLRLNNWSLNSLSMDSLSMNSLSMKSLVIGNILVKDK